ncbi:MAG TPA: DUF2232 domain-containing protein [Xanthobacteraceae bacterium]|jgi:hypothetical protein|uniref:DUF2232 domain-containing protein n=1 Tax=Roseixanthobacter finlandensis TaxID=3119922 RepID=UPI002B82CA86|nr:DUF2232 domain-containing protein [Xanthobacteraceae bacterium]
MAQFLMIGLAAGAASALLVAGIATGGIWAVPFFYLAPLPIMIAGLAFSHVSALAGVAVASIVLGLYFNSSFLIAYLVGIGGPAWALSYGALMARSDAGNPTKLIWFSIGGLVLTCAALSSFSVITAVLSVAGDFETYRTAVAAAFETFVQVQGQTGPASAETARMGELVASILPPMAGALAMVTQLCCLYLAGRAALVSGRLARPWPDLAATRLPASTSLVLALIIAASVVPGMVGLSASVVAATLVTAYAVAGFAVLHFLTRGRGSRILILTAVWLGTLALGWPVLVVALLGVVDAMFDLRARSAPGGRPPAANDR